MSTKAVKSKGAGVVGDGQNGDSANTSPPELEADDLYQRFTKKREEKGASEDPDKPEHMNARSMIEFLAHRSVS